VSSDLLCFDFLESFLLQTSQLYGTTYYAKFKQLIKVNSIMPIQHAVSHLLPFTDKILSKDETYFINETNYIENFNNINLENTTVLEEILKLKDIYHQLDTESKENVWSILQALLQLSIDYLTHPIDVLNEAARYLLYIIILLIIIILIKGIKNKWQNNN
jgi:hypothetical protein